MMRVFVFAAIAAMAYSACDNQCSGHGTCGLDGICKCYDNWGVGIGHISGDCSERTCPYDIAWADAPNYAGNQHNYAECSNQGICNTETGECECFPGYTGAGCARQSCPNDCSGHGLCLAIQNLPFGEVAADYDPNNATDFVNENFYSQQPYTFASSYYSWDKSKSFGCVCDPQWGDYDCSKRMCDYGTDIMDHRLDMSAPQKYQVQKISFAATGTSAAETMSGTFALTFKSKVNETFTTEPIVLAYAASASQGVVGSFADFLKDIQTGLESLPNQVIDVVQVTGEIRATQTALAGSGTQGQATVIYPNVIDIYVSFTGANVQGPQNLLTVRAYPCGDGCTPKLTGLSYLSVQYDAIYQTTAADYSSYECGRRGKCDYTTGICQCFSGYTGQACNTITALV